jgi:hypothetical protein
MAPGCHDLGRSIEAVKNRQATHLLTAKLHLTHFDP